MKKKKLEAKPRGKVSFFRSIKVKLLSSFIIPVIGITILGSVSYNTASNEIINSYITSAEQTVNSIDAYITLVTETVQSRYKGYSNNEEIKHYFSGTYDTMEGGTVQKEVVHYTYQTEFFSHVNSDTLITDIILLNDEHESITTSTLATDTPYTTFIQSENGKVVAADPYNNHWFGNLGEIDREMGTDNSTYALRYAKKFPDKKVMLIIDVSMKAIKESLDTMDAGDDGYVAVVTSDGAEIFSSSSGEANDSVFYGQDFFNNALEAEDTTGCVDVTYNGLEYKFIYSKLGKGLTVCSLISEGYLANKVSGIQSLTMLVVGIVAALSLVVGVTLFIGINKSISRVTSTLNKVADGDFTIRIDAKMKDEFSLIKDSVNHTIDSVSELISSVQDVNSEVVMAANKVYRASELFMERSGDIKASVGEIMTGANKLDDDSNNCLSQMDKLSDKIAMVTNNTSEIGRIVDVTNKSIEAGITSVESVNESANSTTRITGEVITAIEDLQEKSRSIVTIVNTINEIAEETNLLSLNASIEAARAGEAGRGFAVVASEISKLADQSLGSAGKIAIIIDEILAKTNQVVDIAKEAFEIVKAQSSSVEGTTEAFEEMKSNINTLLDSLDEIAKNVENIEGARNITLESVENISSVSAETAACSTSVADAVDSQSEATDILNKAASTLSDKSTLLTELLSKFNV